MGWLLDVSQNPVERDALSQGQHPTTLSTADYLLPPSSSRRTLPVMSKPLNDDEVLSEMNKMVEVVRGTQHTSVILKKAPFGTRSRSSSRKPTKRREKSK